MIQYNLSKKAKLIHILFLLNFKFNFIIMTDQLTVIFLILIIYFKLFLLKVNLNYFELTTKNMED